MADEERGSKEQPISLDSLPAFAQFVEDRREDQHRAYREAAVATGYAERLREAALSYGETHTFEPGNLVQWKPNMRNRPYPIESVPAVVVEVLDSPAWTDTDGEELVEPHDLLIGLLDGESVFRLTRVPAARFRPYTD